MKNKLCLYHKDCVDGFAAAWVMWSALDDAELKNWEFRAVQYGEPAPDVTGLNVLILDFSYPREVLLKMHSEANSLFVIDHHKTAQEALAGLPFCKFDMAKSGCVLTWEHYNPGYEVPELLLYIQDRDLWQWQLEKSREVSAALRSHPFDFELWLDFMDGFGVEDLASEGAAILRAEQQHIASVLKRPLELVEIGGYKVPCVNSTHLISEIGNELAKGHPFAALYFDTAEGKRAFSLRSTSEGVDVSEIAKLYGGGGHRNAAGFTVERPPIL